MNVLFDIPKHSSIVLVKDFNGRDKYVHTSSGMFKLRKNGRVILSIGEGGNRDIIRCTPIL